jgi:uncharacterized protein YecE (DUF72 family)
MNIYLGCHIWSFKGWVGNFYPRGTKPSDFLREYASRLTTIEGNTTFYAVPAIKTIAAWIEQTPESFHFCPKIPKAISHNGNLSDYVDRALQFAEFMRPLASRLGPMFLQLPPSYSPHLLEDLRIFIEAWPHDLRLAVEVRHLDWFDSAYEDSLNQLLSDHNMARVTIDTRPIRNLQGDSLLAGSSYENLLEARERKPDVPVIPKRTADFLFVRYIGHPELQFNLEYLDEWADYFVSQMKDRADVYAFCHSPDNLIGPVLCREFHQRVAKQIVIPPLPWDAMKPDVPEQGKLF